VVEGFCEELIEPQEPSPRARCQPVSLPVIAEQPDRAPATAPKHEHTPGKRILSEFHVLQKADRFKSQRQKKVSHFDIEINDAKLPARVTERA
jgi:hypothetical protein